MRFRGIWFFFRCYRHFFKHCDSVYSRESYCAQQNKCGKTISFSAWFFQMFYGDLWPILFSVVKAEEPFSSSKQIYLYHFRTHFPYDVLQKQRWHVFDFCDKIWNQLLRKCVPNWSYMYRLNQNKSSGVTNFWQPTVHVQKNSYKSL